MKVYSAGDLGDDVPMSRDRADWIVSDDSNDDWSSLENFSLEGEYCIYCKARRHYSHGQLTLPWSWRYVDDTLSLAQVRAGESQNCPGCSLLKDAIEAHVQLVDLPADLKLNIRSHFHFKGIKLRIHRPWSFQVPDEYDVNGNVALEPLQIFELQTKPVVQHLPSDLSFMALPSENTSSKQAMITLADWLSDCSSKHEFCSSAVAHTTSCRILRLTNTHVYLEEGSDRKLHYACLSHCWGPLGPALQLTYSTEGNFRKGLAITDLPKTFSDAVRVSLNVGIQFLWIDALCIRQDDAEDWRNAAATMGDIYASSVLTIAATWSDSSSTGLFSKLDDHSRQKQIKKWPFWVCQLRKKFPYTSRVERPKDWPLLNRAWFYQERTLSPRIVHFGKDQLFWECKSKVLSEDGLSEENVTPEKDNENGSYYFLPFKSSFKNETRSWRKCIQDYSKLQLTYESDRLPAVAAVAKRMMDLRKNDTYVAGMWKNSLLQDLGWECSEQRPFTRLETYIPSWSWASSGSVMFEDYELLSVVKLIDLAFQPVGPAQNGICLDAVITIRAPVFEASLEASATIEYVSFCNTKNETKEAFLSSDCDPAYRKPPLIPANRLLVMIFGRRSTLYYGLVLFEVSNAKFMRIGYTAIRSLPEDTGVQNDWYFKNTWQDDFANMSIPYSVKELKIV